MISRTISRAKEALLTLNSSPWTVPPENSVQPTAKSYRQANRRLNQLAALPESVNEIPKFTTHVTETVRAQISKVRGDPARSAKMMEETANIWGFAFSGSPSFVAVV